MVNITRSTTCVTLDLPVNLVCAKCLNMYEKPKHKRRSLKSCLRPFDLKFAHHREIRKVQVYTKIMNHISQISVVDNLVDIFVYSKIPTTPEYQDNADSVSDVPKTSTQPALVLAQWRVCAHYEINVDIFSKYLFIN